MSPFCMTALRLATFVCHTLPDVRVRLCHEGRVLAEAGWDVEDGTTAGVVRLRPCQLRAAVTEAWRHQRGGRRLAVLGLPEEVDPAIELGVCGPAIHHPGGILTVRYADRWIHGFAATLPYEQARVAIGTATAAAGPDWGGDGEAAPMHVDLHHDELLGATLVWTETSAPVRSVHPAAGTDDGTLEAMRRLLAACAVAELEQELRELAG